MCSFVVIDDLKKIEVGSMCHYIRVKIEYQNNSVEAYEVETCAFCISKNMFLLECLKADFF